MQTRCYHLLYDAISGGMLDMSPGNPQVAKLAAKWIERDFAFPGAIIIFSTEVSAEAFGDPSRQGRVLKRLYYSLLNRLTFIGRIDKTVLRQLQQHHLEAFWLISRGKKYFFYEADACHHFDQNSISVELIGLPMPLIEEIAYQLMGEFRQDAVLIKQDRGAYRLYRRQDHHV